MADDGLLLNLAVDDAPAKPTRVKAVGGRWKDRRKLELRTRGRSRKNEAASGANAAKQKDRSVPRTVAESDGSAAPPTRPAASDSGVPLRKRQISSEQPHAKRPDHRTDLRTDPKVSSLFTSNTPSATPLRAASGSHAPSNAPLSDATTFTGLGVNEQLCAHLEQKLNYSAPTQIQRSVIPALTSVGPRDLLVQAQTGSGKTLAFVLPILDRLMAVKGIWRGSGLFAVILAPTRELANQIYAVLDDLSRCCRRIVPGVVTGGEKRKAEKARLRRGVNILVATPGRLRDHLEHTEALDVSQVRYIVLDEGDKLLELGFAETVAEIVQEIHRKSRINSEGELAVLPKRAVTVLCSATLKSGVRQLGETALRDPELVVGVGEEKNGKNTGEVAVPAQLRQEVVIVPPKLRLVTLAAELRTISRTAMGHTCTIVFLSCSDSVDFHYAVFTRGGKEKFEDTGRVESESKEEGEPNDSDDSDDSDDSNVSHDKPNVSPSFSSSSTFSTSPMLPPSTVVYKLHGSLSQPVRTVTLSHFRHNRLGAKHTVLFCTDVAARGLDLPAISTVIEFDPPFAIEDHLHRVGRTARAGHAGRALLFLFPGKEEKYIEQIKEYHQTFGTIGYESLLQKGFYKKDSKWDYEATTWHLNVERWILSNSRAAELAAAGFTSHVRAYATHLATMREFFNVKSLHLGHLAKAFGLRETPKKLGRQVSGATGNGEESGNGGKSAKGLKRPKEDARHKLLRMARVHEKVSEFNLG